MADSTNEQPAPVTLHVCVTCLKPGEPFEPRDARSGARLYYALESTLDPGKHGAIEIVPVACLSSCKRSCNVAVSSPGKWTYVYGDLAPEHAETLLAGIRHYALTPDGLVPWRERPEIMKRGALARIPPTPAAPNGGRQ